MLLKSYDSKGKRDSQNFITVMALADNPKPKNLAVFLPGPVDRLNDQILEFRKRGFRTNRLIGFEMDRARWREQVQFAKTRYPRLTLLNEDLFAGVVRLQKQKQKIDLIDADLCCRFNEKVAAMAERSKCSQTIAITLCQMFSPFESRDIQMRLANRAGRHVEMKNYPGMKGVPMCTFVLRQIF